MEWINEVKKKDHQKGEKAARSPERLNLSMRRLNKLEISPKKDIENREPNEIGDIVKTKEGASKNLKDYDCWENDLKPEEWIKKYDKIPPPHGKAPIYQGG